MTIAAAWIRRIHSCNELVFVADSRLSGGARTFDYCAKILTLPRSDCAIAFAGSTDNAYPMMHQLSLAIDSFGPLRDRVMDIREVKTHAIKIFDSMASSITNESPHLGPPNDFVFLLGGYSWIAKRFFIWTIRYCVERKGFVAVEAPSLASNGIARKVFLAGPQRVIDSHSNALGQIAFAGDQGPEGFRRLIRMLTDRFARTPSRFDSAALDFEPFEVVCEMLKDPARAHSIGGAPQLVKVYEHLNTQSFAVKWGAPGEEGAFLQGRPLLSYENVNVWIMDPQTLRSARPSQPKGRVNDSQRKVFYRRLLGVLRSRITASESKSG
jgi:hypothetical protein